MDGASGWSFLFVLFRLFVIFSNNILGDIIAV